MADTNLMQQAETTTPENGYFYVVIGGMDYYISYANLVKLLNNPFKTITDKNKNSNYTRTIGTPLKLDSVDVFWKSGSPVISIGTTPGGGDMYDNVPVTTAGLVSNPGIYLGGVNFYISITGGTVTINFNYYEIDI